jgi:cysteinyl-tRNA synthetase
MGFPGWHIECSAMSRKELGQPFDIHAGGVDHIPVHHENEIAQSEAAYGVPLANYWVHVEFLLVDGKKMSKSLKNAFTMDDLRQRGVSPIAFRYYLLGAHYRSKQNFTWEAVKGAQIALEKLYRIVRAYDKPTGGCSELEREFRNAVLDDLNTPAALAVLWKTVDSDFPSSSKAASILQMDEVLGLGLAEIVGMPLLVPVDVRELADARLKARQERNWPEADRLRGDIEGMGWRMLDTDAGYTLERI